MVELYHV
jgi:hypothetical protein